MFRDTQEELKRLEEELLEEDNNSTRPSADSDEDELLAEINQLLGGQEDLDHTRIFNTDAVDEDLESFSEAVREPRQKESLKGLAIAAIALTVGILGLVAWWAVRLLG